MNKKDLLQLKKLYQEKFNYFCKNFQKSHNSQAYLRNQTLLVDQLIIQVPSLFFADWVENHYLAMIQLAVKEETALVPKVSFVVEQASEPEQKALNPTPAANQVDLMHKPYQPHPEPSIQTSPVEPIKTLDSPEGNASVSDSAPKQPSALN